MTVEIAIEDFCESGDELYPLFQSHYDEITHHKEAKELAPDWDLYRAMEEQGKVLTVVARDQGHVIGYMTTFLYRHPHYRYCIVATNDLFYVAPDYRGQGVAGKLLVFTENELRDRGATVHTMHMKTDFDFSDLMAKTGFDRSEVIWEKVL